MKILKKYESTILFILGFGLFLFTRMSKLVPTIPSSILISTVFILRFVRIKKAATGILLTLLGFIISINIGLWGLFDMGSGISSLLFNLIRSTVLALLYFFPYLADRLIYPRYRKFGVLSSLTFPVISTALFFFLTIEGPFEGSYQMGKFLFGPAILKQFISIFGLPGMVFISNWFASIINYCWENNFGWKKTGRLITTYSIMILAILVYGTVKIHSNPVNETVKTASIVLIPEDGKAVELPPIVENKITHDYRKRLGIFRKKVETAASNGAKIAMSHELAILINEDDREDLINECRSIAKDNNMYIAMNYGYYANKGKGENTMLFIDNTGRVLIRDYAKKYLIGIGNIAETAVFKKGPEILQYADTPYGKVSFAICREVDMAKYMIQAGRNNVDIMISPAYEWPQNLTINCGYMRGIEFGFSLVRASYNGITFASDYNGKILATMPFEKDSTGIMYAELPVKGVKTLYSKIGDVFAWICVLIFLGLILYPAISKIWKKMV